MNIQASIMYPGHAFHDQFPKGRSSGELWVESDGIGFRHEQVEQVLPLQGLTVELGGASDRLVFFSHSSYPDWKFYTAERAILNDPALRAAADIAPQLNRAKGKRVFNHGVLVTVLALVVLAPVAFFAFLDELSGVVARQVPAEWEAGLGETVFDQYRVQHTLMDAKQTQALLQPLTEPLLNAVQTDRYQFHIHIANAPEINAFALPGGYIVLHSGLILKAQSAEEVLGVLAHEIAHVTEQHGLRNIISTAGSFLVIDALLGDISGILAVLVDAGPLLLRQSYSREFEADADDHGFDLLTRANIDPQGLVSFFETVKAEEAKRLQKIEDKDTRDLVEGTFGLLSSHPATDARIDAMNQRLQQLSAADYLRFDAPFAALKQQVAAFVAEHEQETAPDESQR